ncbi:MAG: hypothetical protein NC409_13205 [Clostridium sp.]|nr:hypothetical protein [Clostridium sp.]
MSRDLKTEYEAMLDQEIPDLWSRIEPRLADKKSAAADTVLGGTHAETDRYAETDMHAEMDTYVQTDILQFAREESTPGTVLQKDAGTNAGRQGAQPIGKRMHRRRIKRSTVAVWGSLAAACICLVIILPAWRGSKNRLDNTNQGAAADDNTASGAVMDHAGSDNMAVDTAEEAEAPAEGGAAAAKNEAQSESSAMNGMAQEGAPAESPAESYDISADDADMAGTESAAEPENIWIAEADAAQTDGAGDYHGTNTENASAPLEEEGEADGGDGTPPGSAVYYDGEVVDAWRTEEGFFYRMELAGDAGASLPGETEILIWQKAGLLSGLPGRKEQALEIGKDYTVTVEPEAADGEIRYVLIGYEADEGK